MTTRLRPPALLLLLLLAAGCGGGSAPAPAVPEPTGLRAPAAEAACAQLGQVRAELASLQGRLQEATRPGADPALAAERGALQARLQQLQADEARLGSACTQG